MLPKSFSLTSRDATPMDRSIVNYGAMLLQNMIASRCCTGVIKGEMVPSFGNASLAYG